MVDEDAQREELIRTAMRTINHGTQEVHATFSQARGPLSKAIIKDLHRRVKDLRQTAESAEDAFRDWTVELSGKPYEKDGKLRYDELRASFEEEVASIQHAMQRVADEVKRRQASKANAANAETDCEDPPTLERLVEPPAPPARTVPAPGSSPSAPPRRAPTSRSTEAMVSSHAVVANRLQNIASQADRSEGRIVGGPSSSSSISNALGASDSAKTVMRERIKGIHPFMKYIVWIALASLGYIIWVEARYLVLNSAHEEALREARAGQLHAPSRRLH